MELKEADFKRLSQLVYEKAGINLHEGKKELLKARLCKRLREGGFSSFKEYYEYVVKDPTGEELIRLLDSISTNYTSFFRETAHFDFLTEVILPELLEKRMKGNRKIRLWSAGCASGEEPYSMAITVLEVLKGDSRWDVRVLASDISTRALNRAQTAIYKDSEIGNIPMSMLKKYFLKGRERWEGYVKVKPEVKKLILFFRHNLLEPLRYHDQMDVIFCRNVMIYFNKNTQKRVLKHLTNALTSGGYLFVGHAESLYGLNTGLKYVRPAIYRKL